MIPIVKVSRSQATMQPLKPKFIRARIPEYKVRFATSASKPKFIERLVAVVFKSKFLAAPSNNEIKLCSSFKGPGNKIRILPPQVL